MQLNKKQKRTESELLLYISYTKVFDSRKNSVKIHIDKNIT